MSLEWDDEEAEAWINREHGPSDFARIARNMGSLYAEFLKVGFVADQAFDLARDYFGVMLDVIEMPGAREG